MKPILLVKKLLGLIEMKSGLVNASFSLPEWQAVKMSFFAPCRDEKFLFECQIEKYFISECSEHVKYFSPCISNLYINTNEIPNHFTLIFLLRKAQCSHSKGELFRCSFKIICHNFHARVKISCFSIKALLVFHWWLYNKKI